MKNKIIKFLKEEYVNGYNLFDYIFMLVLIAMQVVVFCIYPDKPLSIIAGILGTIATILCAKGKITYYVYGFIQTFMFILIDYSYHLYIDTLEQCFYFLTMIYGVICWKKNLNKTSKGSVEIKSKKLNLKLWIGMIISIVVLTIGLGYAGTLINSAQSYTDAFSNILAIFAQILCVTCYKEQWILWLILDIVDIKMYMVAGDKVLAIMYVGWALNCIYGWYCWNKTLKK